MKLFVPEAIEQYAHDHTQPRSALFDELRAYTYAHMKGPHMQVGRVQGTFLELCARLVGARRILEIGTFTGYSALCMAEALPEEGELITCDHDPRAAEVAQSFFDRSPHGKKISIRLGDGLETLRSLDDRWFDMAFVDADKARYPAYFDGILPRLRPGGLCVFDNVLWSGEVLDPQTDDARGIARLNEQVQADDRVTNVLLTIRDGVLVLRKN